MRSTINMAKMMISRLDIKEAWKIRELGYMRRPVYWWCLGDEKATTLRTWIRVKRTVRKSGKWGSQGDKPREIMRSGCGRGSQQVIRPGHWVNQKSEESVMIWKWVCWMSDEETWVITRKIWWGQGAEDKVILMRTRWWDLHDNEIMTDPQQWEILG